jgi:hypothetical protein
MNRAYFRFICGDAQGGTKWERYDIHISKEPLGHPASLNSFGKCSMQLCEGRTVHCGRAQAIL